MLNLKSRHEDEVTRREGYQHKNQTQGWVLWYNRLGCCSAHQHSTSKCLGSGQLWFLIQLPASSLGKQQIMAWVLGCLPPSWDTPMAHLLQASPLEVVSTWGTNQKVILFLRNKYIYASREQNRESRNKPVCTAHWFYQRQQEHAGGTVCSEQCWETSFPHAELNQFCLSITKKTHPKYLRHKCKP